MKKIVHMLINRRAEVKPPVERSWSAHNAWIFVDKGNYLELYIPFCL